MRIVSVAFGAALCVAPLIVMDSAAKAAPPPTPAPWTGLYFGGHVGASAASLPVDYSDGTHWDGLGFFGGEAGAFAGFNWQVNPAWVVGGEVDGTWLGLHNIDYDGNENGFINWMASIDARVGRLLSPNTLLYAKAGWGLIGIDIPAASYVAPGAGPRQLNAIQAGIGLETAFAANWRARVEAVYTRALDAYSVDDGGMPPFGFNLRPEILAARIGLIYALGGGMAPMQPQPMPDAGNWSGMYFGGQAGWAISDTREEFLAGPQNGTSWDGFGASSGNVGAFVGVNKQIGSSSVVGLELNGLWMGLRNYDTFSTLLWGRTDWMASLDARAGVLVNPKTLLYAKAGWALVDFTSNYPGAPPFPPPAGPDVNQILNAIQVGIGLETQMSAHWSARVEGLYTAALKGLEFDTVPATQNHSFRPQILSGEFGVAYRY